MLAVQRPLQCLKLGARVSNMLSHVTWVGLVGRQGGRHALYVLHITETLCSRLQGGPCTIGSQPHWYVWRLFGCVLGLGWGPGVLCCAVLCWPCMQRHAALCRLGCTHIPMHEAPRLQSAMQV
jgi:hypothetical protein